MNEAKRRAEWLYPMVTLATVALTLVAALFTTDHYLNPGDYANPWEHYWAFQPDMVSNSVGVMSSIIAAVLGITITVVSIVVQLAATRYTPAVTEMFFRDRTNLIVMSIYVVGSVMGFWIAFGVNTNFVPSVSLLVLLIVSTVGFVLMAPYFAYVFRFLNPQAVVARITSDSLAAGVGDTDGRVKGTTQQRHIVCLTGAERLSDIAINSISQKDKIIATACVDALRELCVTYLRQRPTNPAWFELTPTIRSNPDFASMAEDSLEDLAEQRTWFEFKVLRQFQAIYSEALGCMRDINYVIAINTRHIAEAALQTGHERALELTIKFFNTYMRATLNDNDVRTAYTILNQYRKIGESVLRSGGDSTGALRIAGHIKYYGHLSYEKKLAFVTETVAYDLGSLCQVAHEVGSAVERDLLQIFLDVDPKDSEGEVQETSLRGVRKAQVKLAAYYLAKNEIELARTVFDDMAEESPERLRSIHNELIAVESKDFWEVSDRGGNFDYIAPELRKELGTFFGWFKTGNQE